MSEERFNQLETIVTQHSQEIRGIYVALGEITATMKAFASGIVDLREQDARLSQKVQDLTESQQSLIEAQRTLFDSVERLNNTVEVMATRIDEMATQTAEDRRIWQAEIRQILEYLLSQRNNGNSNS